VVQKRKKTSREQVSSTRRKKRGLVNADAKHFKELLMEKRREILRNVSEFEDEALRKSHLDATGDLSSMPIHMADLGTDNYEQEFALGLMDSERKLLREDKTYGICEATGKPISKARLKAQPWARFCVEHARMLEQGLVAEQEE